LMIARALTACDGETTAVAIARVLVADPEVELADEAEVYEVLEELVERKLLVWTLEPSALIHPERELRRLLERIEVAAVRERVLGVLARLEAVRTRIADAAGDMPRLESALEEIDATFLEVTGQAATRRGGETYA